MLMSERLWRILSLLERLGRGKVTVGEVAASLGRSRRQVQRMRMRKLAAAPQGWFMATRGAARSTGRRRRSVSKC